MPLAGAQSTINQHNKKHIDKPQQKQDPQLLRIPPPPSGPVTGPGDKFVLPGRCQLQARSVLSRTAPAVIHREVSCPWPMTLTLGKNMQTHLWLCSDSHCRWGLAQCASCLCATTFAADDTKYFVTPRGGVCGIMPAPLHFYFSSGLACLFTLRQYAPSSERRTVTVTM